MTLFVSIQQLREIRCAWRPTVRDEQVVSSGVKDAGGVNLQLRDWGPGRRPQRMRGRGRQRWRRRTSWWWGRATGRGDAGTGDGNTQGLSRRAWDSVEPRPKIKVGASGAPRRGTCADKQNGARHLLGEPQTSCIGKASNLECHRHGRRSARASGPYVYLVVVPGTLCGLALRFRACLATARDSERPGNADARSTSSSPDGPGAGIPAPCAKHGRFVPSVFDARHPSSFAHPMSSLIDEDHQASKVYQVDRVTCYYINEDFLEMGYQRCDPELCNRPHSVLCPALGRRHRPPLCLPGLALRCATKPSTAHRRAVLLLAASARARTHAGTARARTIRAVGWLHYKSTLVSEDENRHARECNRSRWETTNARTLRPSLHLSRPPRRRQRPAASATE